MPTLCLCTVTTAFKTLWDTLHVHYEGCEYGGRARVALSPRLLVLILLALQYFTFCNAQAQASACMRYEWCNGNSFMSMSHRAYIGVLHFLPYTIMTALIHASNGQYCLCASSF